MTETHKILLCFLLLIFVFYGCNNRIPVSKSQDYCGCFELPDFDTTRYPISDMFEKPYIDIIKTYRADSGCVYIARTAIFLDSVQYNNIILYKKDEKIIVKLTDVKSDEFIFFDFNLKTNEPNVIQIKYCDSLLQDFNATLDDKVIMRNKETAYIYRICDFFYWRHNGLDFTASGDVILFITERQGIIGSYIEMKSSNGALVMISPSGNILSEFKDYKKIQRVYLE